MGQCEPDLGDEGSSERGMVPVGMGAPSMVKIRVQSRLWGLTGELAVEVWRECLEGFLKAPLAQDGWGTADGVGRPGGGFV